MKSPEQFGGNAQEQISDPETLLFLKKVDSLKYLHMMNQFCLPAIAEDMKNMLLYKRPEGTLIDIVTPKLDETKVVWQKLLDEGKLPAETRIALDDFSIQSDLLLKQMEAVNESQDMSEQERENIQNTARSVMEAMNQILKLRPEEV